MFSAVVSEGKPTSRTRKSREPQCTASQISALILIANPFPPYSLQERPKFVPNLSKMCPSDCFSMPSMTGRPGCRTMEIIGGSSAPYLARTPCVPLFCTSFNRVGNKERFRLRGAGGGSFPLYGGTFARSYSVSSFGGFQSGGLKFGKICQNLSENYRFSYKF